MSHILYSLLKQYLSLILIIDLYLISHMTYNNSNDKYIHGGNYNNDTSDNNDKINDFIDDYVNDDNDNDNNIDNVNVLILIIMIILMTEKHIR